MEGVSCKSLWTLVSGEGLKTEKVIHSLVLDQKRDLIFYTQVLLKRNCLLRKIYSKTAF